MLSRRTFCLLLAGTASSLARAEEKAGRKLDFRIAKDFSDASSADIEAVVRSAAGELWKRCPNTHWKVSGFSVFFRKEGPITLYEHRPDGWIAIGLNIRGRVWAQVAFQFAHEFCHALAGHSNDWEKLHIRGPSANLWLEESICETASLFSLRSMGHTWESSPPYPNWTGFSKHLTEYATNRLDEARKILADGEGFEQWFKKEQQSLREKATQRDKNCLIASRLLPLFESEPAGWESVTFCNLAERVPNRTLSQYLEDWIAHSPPAHQSFIRKIAGIFGVML